MILRGAALVACAGVAIGCGGRRAASAPAAASAPVEACVELAGHAASVINEAGLAAGHPRPPPLMLELWTSLYVDACRQDQWSAPSHDCYRAASSVATMEACEEAQPESERTGLRRLIREARHYLPDRSQASGTRDEVQARYVMPVWGHPPAAGDTFAACEAYVELLVTLRACTSYQDQHLDIRISILEAEREQFAERSPRVRGMWLGYCDAEAARRRAQWSECLATGPSG